MPSCRTCGEPIQFTRLANGQYCPVESLEPEEYRVYTQRPRHVTERDFVKTQRLVVSGEILTVYHVIENGKRIAPGPCRLTVWSLRDQTRAPRTPPPYP